MSRPQTWLDEFKAFLMQGNLVLLAVAFVIGTAFAALVGAFVTDWVTPIIGAIFGGKGPFGSLKFTLHSSDFSYGHFIRRGDDVRLDRPRGLLLRREALPGVHGPQAARRRDGHAHSRPPRSATC